MSTPKSLLFECLICVVSREDPTAAVGTKLRRIFLERGLDFFEAEKDARSAVRDVQDDAKEGDTASGEGQATEPFHHMTPEELYKMRMELTSSL